MVNKPLVTTVISPLLFLLLAAGGAAAVEEAPAGAPAADPQLLVGETAPPEEDRQVEVLEQKGGSLGYDFVFSDRFGGRALEYGALKSSRNGGLFYRRMDKDTNLELEGFYLNGDDYHGDLLVDYRGDYRLHLRTESLYHNLDRELLFSPSFDSVRTDAPGTANYSALQDPYANYGVSVVQDRADFRYRLHNYPLHVNLGYWRYTKEGTIQQRFADASFEGAANVVRAEARPLHQQIQEGRIGLDAHLGWVDLVYDFKYRFFDEKFPTPVALYEPRNGITGTPELVGGLRQHNENPDSRFTSHTVKLHSSLAGGLVGSASYSVDQRENLSQLSDTSGARHMKVYLQHAAGDLAYTPNREYTFSLKYRRQELDNGGRGALLSSNFVDPVQVYKEPVDTTRNLLVATASYRPLLELSLVGEYRGDFVRRNNVSELPTVTSWALPENSATNTGSLALYYRPVKGLRTSAHYSYAATDHPAYGASFAERQEGKLLATYSRSSAWGATAHLIVRRDENDEVKHFLIPSLVPLTYEQYPLTSRKSNSENTNVGVWCVPVAGLTVGGNYSYLHNEVEKAVLYTTVLTGSEAASQFSSRSQVYALFANWTAAEKLDLSCTLQQVRSKAALTPTDTVFTAFPGSTAGIQQISEQYTVISSLSGRGEYRFNSALSALLEYTLRDYDERKPAYSSYSGTVHTIMAGVAAKW